MKPQSAPPLDIYTLDIGDGIPDPRSLGSYDRTKDISYHPFFRKQDFRWFWRMWVFRVTPAGKWFIGLTAVLLLLGLTSLDIQIYVPAVYAGAIWLSAWLIAMFLPPKAKVSASVPERVAAGAFVPVKLSVTSFSRWPLAEIVVFPMGLPPYIDCVPKEGKTLLQLNPGETVETEIALYCYKRGNYKLQGFRVDSSFPIGLLRAYTNTWQTHKILVYPTFQPLSYIDLPTGRTYQPGGVALASKLGDSTEFIGNREYRDGDNVRDIDWMATARFARPIIREYREEYFYRVGVIQDTFVPVDDVEREADFERSISLCAAVSDYMARQEYVVDLFAAGPNLYHLTAGRSLAFQDQILDILANLMPVSSEPFQIIEPELLESLAQLTTVICVLLDWDETRRQFVERIRQISAVKVLIVRDGPCRIDPLPEAEALSLIVITKEIFQSGVWSL